MPTRPTLIAAAIIGLLAPSSLAQSQAIRVSLRVTDEKLGGIFTSGFGSAFRALGDVEVVTPGEDGDYIVRVVTICDGVTADCSTAQQYALSISLSEGFSRSDAYFAVHITRTGLLLPSDTTVGLMKQLLHQFEKHHQIWVALWGRNRYEQLIRQQVAEIDARCFEKSRIMRRLFRENPNKPLNEVASAVSGRDWVC